MTIRLIMAGELLPIDPLEVQGIPRSGDYIRVDENNQFIVLFAAYVVGQDAVDIHVATATESERQYADRLTAPRL